MGQISEDNESNFDDTVGYEDIPSDEDRVAAAMAALDNILDGTPIDERGADDHDEHDDDHDDGRDPVAEQARRDASDQERREAAAIRALSGDDDEEDSEEADAPTDKPADKDEDAPTLSADLAERARRRREDRSEAQRVREEYEQRIQQMQQSQGEVLSVEELRQLAVTNPVALYQRLGVTDRLGDHGLALMHEELGENVPESERLKYELRQQQAQMQQLSQQIEQARQEAANQIQEREIQQRMVVYQQRLSDFASAVPEDLPHLRLVASQVDENGVKGADKVAQALYAEAARRADEGDTRIYSAADLAKALEQNLRKFAQQFAPLYGESSSGNSTSSSDPEKPAAVRKGRKRSMSTSNQRARGRSRRSGGELTVEDREQNAIRALEASLER